MSCDRYKEMMLNQILGEQDISKNTELLKHIDECADCRLEYGQLCAAADILKPQQDERLSPIERLRLENALYKAQLSQLSASRKSTHILFKRMAAVAAAFLFMFIGFSIHFLYQESGDLKGGTIANGIVNDVLKRQEYFSSGQRMSARGLLLIAKGRKALEQFDKTIIPNKPGQK